MENHKHIGDGVYISNDGYQLWIAVNNHNNPVVALDYEVFTTLVKTGADMFKEMKGEPT